MKHLLTTAAIATMLVASPALAADDAMKKQDQAQAQKPAQTEMQKPDQAQTSTPEASTPDKMAATDSGEFVASQKKTDWLSSDIVGQSVQNAQGDALGDINNIIVDEQGSVVAVVIGVGGFLGIGEKDVGVRYDMLEFKEAPRPAATTAQPNASQPSGSPMAGGQAKSPTGAGNTAAAENPQDNMVIVLNTSKEQLEAAPQYKYIGEEAEAASETPAKKQ